MGGALGGGGLGQWVNGWAKGESNSGVVARACVLLDGRMPAPSRCLSDEARMPAAVLRGWRRCTAALPHIDGT